MARTKNDVYLFKKGKTEIKIENANLRNAVLTLRALSHDFRIQIISMLNENEKMPVTDIFCALRVEQSVASQHLAILRKSGIVNTERQGKFIYYTLNHERLKHINELIESIAK